MAVTPYLPAGISSNIPSGGYQFPNTSNIPMPSQGQLTMPSGIPGVAPFSFNFAEVQRQAYEELRDFYNRLLDFAGGDMDLARRVLDYSYQQGTREATQEYQQQSGELSRLFPQETEQMNTGLNRRGMISSGVANTERGRLQGSQDARMLAVERALQNRESRLASERGFGQEQAARGFEREQFNLERERRQEAGDITQQRYGVRSAQYQSELQQAAQEEQRRVQAEQNRATQNLFSGGSTGGGVPAPSRAGSAGGDAAFRQFMAQTGRQGELDRATMGGTQQGSAYQALRRQYGY